MIYETERLYLRRITENDLDAFYDIMGNDDTMNYLGKTLSHEEIGYYISDVSKQTFSDDEGEYAIVLKDSNQVIGQFSITTKKRDKRSEISYMFSNKYWNKGYGYECTKHIVDYLFDVLGMNKVIADCDVSNTGSIKLLEKLGFKKEGTLKQHRFSKRTNEFYDVAVFGLLSKKRRKAS